MSVVAVIPARYASSRYPGKPLVDIAGKTMIRRVYEQVVSVEGIDMVCVATDDERIADAVRAFGGKVVMTGADCVSGTDRVAKAVADIDAEYVINIQGDQVVIDLECIASMIGELKSGCGMATIAAAVEDEREAKDPNCVKVVCDSAGDALYFSRCPIPYVRSAGHCRMLKHIGIYGFSRDTLERFNTLAPSELELTESLEQLRALENGIPIRVVIAEGRFDEINTPEDRTRLMEKLG